MYRACLFGTQISDISNQEKRNILPTGKKTFISVAFDVKNYYSGIFYSRSTVERVNSLLKKILQTINLAGSCWVPLFPELLLSVLQSIALRTDDVTKTCPPPLPSPPRLRQALAISARGRKNAVWKRTVCDQFCSPF